MVISGTMPSSWSFTPGIHEHLVKILPTYLTKTFINSFEHYKENTLRQRFLVLQYLEKNSKNSRLQPRLYIAEVLVNVTYNQNFLG